MDIPAIFNALESTTIFSEQLLPVWLVLCLVALQITDRGAVLMPGLLITFLLIGIAVSRVAMPHIAFGVWVFGLFVVLILYLSLRGLPHRVPVKLMLQEYGYRLLIGLALGMMAALLGYFTQFPSGSAVIASIVWPLLILGLLRFGIAKRGLEMGIGVLLVLAAVGVWLMSINDSPIILGLWSAGSIFLALAIGWLTDRTEGPTAEAMF